MSNVKNKSSEWFHFESFIYGEQHKVFRPHRIVFETIKITHEHNTNLRPLKYQADALVSIAAMKLMENKSTYSNDWHNKIQNLWQNIDPHFGMYYKVHHHVTTLNPTRALNIPHHLEELDQSIHHVIDDCIESDCIDLKKLMNLIDVTYIHETKTGQPLLYDFKTQVSSDTRDKLLTLYSLLFNLRALVAMDYNANIKDASVEAVKVDAITDYIPKAEYVANDAALYFKFLKLTQELKAESQFSSWNKRFINPMKTHFKNYSHNGASLVEGLPPSFIDKLPDHQIEDFLYLVQMDWLLGSDAGLLYKIREEIFGLLDGYETIFWPDCISQSPSPTQKLHLICEIEHNRNYKFTKAS